MLFRSLSTLPPSPSPHPTPLATHAITLANYVPEFTRIGQPINDFVNRRDFSNFLPGFNGDDYARLMVPDLINASNLYYIILCISLAIAVVYLELGALVNDFLQEQDFEKLEEEFLKRQKKEKKRRQRPSTTTTTTTTSSSSVSDVDEVQIQRNMAIQRAKEERRRGLGWLALATSLALWCTGILTEINPFSSP